MPDELGRIKNGEDEYTYVLPMTVYDHECEDWEADTEGLFPQPVPALIFDANYIGLKYKVTCSHCSGVLDEVDLVEA